jgi:hypothetical protein
VLYPLALTQSIVPPVTWRQHCQILPGRPADALAITEEAHPDLAHSLINLGDSFPALGRPADTLPVQQQAVATYRELAKVDPNRYRPELAHSLPFFGDMLSALGREPEAKKIRAEVDRLIRRL